ncbi:unnamed protein product [Chrysodeixis includens]|uniref:Sorbitol dehydrogenase n=1 Tax=Chrysodeixis includens TaxID=689277 RepID=A0A9N8L3I8_CHRIL|nr:unnamed protein product [Chrysodeixis includens]
MATDNLTAMLNKTKDLQLIQTPIPTIADDEVLLRMDCVGICGSDVHYWQTGACGPFVLHEPMIMGHEASGVVAKVGPKVTNLVVGDRVAIEPGVPCRYCEFCKTGRYHLCPDMKFCATPPVHGNLVRYYKHAADFCYKLPDHVTMEEGALLEPLSVGIHACRRAGLTGGHVVLVLGAGPIGLLTMLSAKAMGASKVLITDVLQSRLDFAKQLGADHTLLVTRESKEEDVLKSILELLGGNPDVSFDASGATATVRMSLLEDLPIPDIGEDDVLIEMHSIGICGSDVKLYTTGVCGHEMVKDPIVLGHEGAGVIVKIGKAVKSLAVGDRVSIEPTQPCRACEYCKLGRYNLCVKPHYCSTMTAPGNLCRYYKHVADFCHKMPDDMSMDEGAAVQPLAIAMHACNRAGICLGQTVAILGAGPIGILCAMTARAMGASKILITDVVQSRLDTARELGADCTVLIKRDSTDQEVVDRIVAQLGKAPDVTIDACGYASAQRIAMTVTKTGGVVLVVGIGAIKVEVPLTQALLREVDIRGSYRIANT